jgi:hypothetical protein
MIAFQALVAAIGRQLGRLLNTAFGWATMLLFGKVPQQRQLLLSGISAAAVLWMVVLIGIAIPTAGTFLLAFVPLPKWVDQTLARLVMLALAVVLPALIGVAALFLTEPERRPKGVWAKLKAIARGYPYALGLALTLVMLMVAAPILKLRDIVRRWKSTHIPIVVEPGDYEELVHQVQGVLRQEGMETTRGQPTWLLRWPTKVLVLFARSQVQGMIADRLAVLEGDNFEAMLHPSDLVISGREEPATRAHAALTERLTGSKAYLTWTKESQDIEDCLNRLFQKVRGGTISRARSDFGVRQIDQRLKRTGIAYEEWEILFREKVLLEREILSSDGAGATARSIKSQARQQDITNVQVPEETTMTASDESDCPAGDDRAEQSIIQLVKELRDETTLLIRQEVQLAKTEVREKVGLFARNGAYIAVGALLAYLGVIVLALAAAAGVFVGLRAAEVSTEIAMWLAPFVIGLGVLVIGGIFVLKAIHTLSHAAATPQNTTQTIKENARWVRQRAGGAT